MLPSLPHISTCGCKHVWDSVCGMSINLACGISKCNSKQLQLTLLERVEALFLIPMTLPTTRLFWKGNCQIACWLYRKWNAEWQCFTLLKSRGHLLLKGPNDLRPVHCQGGLATSVISINIHLLGSMKGSGQSLVKEGKLFSKDCDERPRGIQRLSTVTFSLSHSPKNWPVLSLLKCSFQNVFVYDDILRALGSIPGSHVFAWCMNVKSAVWNLSISSKQGTVEPPLK